MVLKRLCASFGKLQNAQLSLKEGLNIVAAPNEAGKSTWLAFIFTMLYGLDTRSRDKKEALAEKNRYSPWSGALMQGSLDCVVSGHAVTIERSTLRASSPMGRFAARFTDSAESVPGLTAENAGQRLLGVPREVYERSALIRQTGLAVEQHAELERRISALVSTGEETLSFTEISGRLRGWQRNRQHNKSGLIPKLDAELESLEETLGRLYRINARTSLERSALEELTQKKEELIRARSAFSLLEARGNWERLAKAEADRDMASASLARLKKQAGTQLPARERLQALRRELSALDQLRASLLDAEKTLLAARNDVSSAEDRIRNSPFSGMPPDDAWESARTDLREFETWRKRASFGKLPLVLWIVSLSALFAASFFMTWEGLLTVWMPVIPLALLAGGVLVLLQMGRAERLRASSAMTLLLQKYDAPDSSCILEAAARYREEYVLAEQRRRNADHLKDNAASLSEQWSGRRRDLLERIRLLDPSVTEEAAAEEALVRALALADGIESASAALQNSQLVYDALKSSLTNIAPPVGEAPVVPERSREAVEAELAETEDDIRRLSASLYTAQGNLNAIGDPAVLEAERKALSTRRTLLRRDYDAITEALGTLEEANAILQARFSPPLNEKAGEIMAVITAGKYNRVSVDRSLSALAGETGEIVSRSHLSLSQGALDQLYLAVRLAIGSLVLPSDTCPPLLMDDALCNFDDRRMAHALEYLLEESANRQIVLFTCHSREADYMKNRRGVHIAEDWWRP